MVDQPIWVVVDAHEGSRPGELLGELGASVKIRQLPAGDYLVGSGAVIERKTVKDLHLTLVEGRLWRQIDRIRRYPCPYLLVEGSDLGDGPVRRNAIRGALLAVMDQRVNVLNSEDLDDSMQWLFRLAHRRQRRVRRDRPVYAQLPAPQPGAQAAEALLAAVPGISVKTARALLRRFGSVRGVLEADPGEWCAVRGMGPTRAGCLTQTIDHEFTVDLPAPP